MKYLIIIFFQAFFVLGSAQTQLDSTKLENNLFHPTPKKLMRSFETDRPDVTESPFTVDVGHFQFETDLFKTDHSKVDGVKTIQNYFNAANLKLGITNSMDLQFIVETFVTQKITDGTFTQKKSGIGNLSIRVKQNIWGNDNGKTALAILPFVIIPTTQNAKITGGLIIPLSISFPGDWEFGTEIETDIEENQLKTGYHISNLVSATISHQLFRKCDFFLESLASRNNELRSNDYTINFGLIYELEKNFNIDSGIYYGLRATSSKVYFIGLSFRY